MVGWISKIFERTPTGPKSHHKFSPEEKRLPHTVYKNSPQETKELIDNGVDVNIEAVYETSDDLQYHWSLLHQSIAHGYTDIVKLLLDAGAQPNVRNQQGMTPLMFASNFGVTEVVSMLLECKADPTAKDNIGRTPLSLATGQGHSDVVELLGGV
jgi:ankyrin repeat protein